MRTGRRRYWVQAPRIPRSLARHTLSTREKGKLSRQRTRTLDALPPGEDLQPRLMIACPASHSEGAEYLRLTLGRLQAAIGHRCSRSGVAAPTG